MRLKNFQLVTEGHYRHAGTGLLFTLVDGGRFDFGMSEYEESLLRYRPSDFESEVVEHFVDEHVQTARPVQKVDVKPFLIANFPLTVDFVTEQWGFGKRQLSKEGAGYVPSSVAILPMLEQLELRLPSETEWEYCHRHFTPLKELPESGDYLQLVPGQAIGAFGSYAEICADVWQPSLDGIPTDGKPRPGTGPRTIRGGAANLYPWQGCGEWLGLMPFDRYSEEYSELLSVRPAADVVSDV